MYLLTMFDARPRYARMYIQQARKSLSKKLLSTIIRTNVKLKEAASIGNHIYQYDQESYGAIDYLKLAKEISIKTKSEVNPFVEKMGSKKPEKQEARKEAQQISQYTFSITNPSAKNIYVVGDFNGWEAQETYKLINSNGEWSIILPLKPGEYRYKYIVDGKWMPDPKNPLSESDSFGGVNSIAKVA